MQQVQTTMAEYVIQNREKDVVDLRAMRFGGKLPCLSRMKMTPSILRKGIPD
jgi:hypothetical protein